MDVKSLLYKAFVFIGIAEAYKPLSREVGHEYAAKLNSYRHHVEPRAAYMPDVTYNFEFQNQLIDIVKEEGSAWFYESSNNKTVIRQGWNGYYVEGDGMQFAWHDTCNSMTQECAIDNLIFRGKQKNCILYEKCSPLIWSGFRSCMTVPLPTGPHNNCSYAFNYYPWFIYSGLKQVSCIVLDYPGPFADPKEKDSVWCYGKYEMPKNDRPYLTN